MKAKNKILLGVSAASGVIASFGAAIALYKNASNAADLNIGIGAVESYTQSLGNLNYSFGDISFYSDEECTTKFKKGADDIDDTSLKLTPTVNNIYIKAPLSFGYQPPLTDSPEQPYAVGTLKVSVSINTGILEQGSVTASAKIKGYPKTGENSDQDTYFTAAKSGNFFTAGLSNNEYPVVTFNKDSTKTESGTGFNTVTHYIDTAIEKDTQYCAINLDFSKAITDDTYLDIAEITDAFKVTLSWGDYDTSTERNNADIDNKMNPKVYVRGNTNEWTSSNDYRMVPNVKGALKTDTSNNYLVEWMYDDLVNFDEIKVYDDTLDGADEKKWISCRNSNETGKKDGVTTTDGGNAQLTKEGYKYDVYYVRGATSDAGFLVESEAASSSGSQG